MTSLASGELLSDDHDGVIESFGIKKGREEKEES